MKSRASRAVIYMRQSTFREESISLELQETACREYARRQGYEVVGAESDPGISGRTFNRPGVQAVMAMVERGEAEVIVLWKWSRWSRNRLDWYVAADKAQQSGGRIESATEPIDTSTSIGRLSRGMMIEIAAFESERAGDQWKEALERRVRRGLPHDGRPRFGYIYDRDAQTYSPDPATGPILTDLYQRFIAGESFSRLTRWLQDRGVPTAFGADYWALHSIKAIMDSGFAAGRIRFRGQTFDGAHERLIDEPTWAAYQEARERRRGKPRAEGTPYLLTGILTCGTCGSSMSGWTHNRGGYVYYRCTRATLHGNHQNRAVRADVVERAVFEEVMALADGPIEAAPGPAPEVDLPALRADVEKRRRALANLTVKNVEGTITDDAYQGAARVLQDRLDDAQAKLRAAEARPAQVQPTVDTAVRLVEDWDLLPVERRREGIRALIASVTVDLARGKRVTVNRADAVSIGA